MNISSQHHSFDIALAGRYGVEHAILIHHFQHWIRINRYKKRNIRDGHCWTYQSRRDIQAHFPYWNVDRVKYLCEQLVEMGVLVTANYNKNPIDKTLWYAFADEKAFGVDDENSNNVYEGQKCPSKGKSAQPIPDTKTHIQKERAKALSKREPTALGIELASILWQKIRHKNEKAKQPDLNHWGAEIDDMMRLDNRTEPEVRNMLDFIFLKDDFWYQNILSPSKLKKHFDAITLRMKSWKSSQTPQTGFINSKQSSSASDSPALVFPTPEQRLRILNGSATGSEIKEECSS